MKNINIKEIITNLEIYKIENKELPYLMREYPFLHELAVILLEQDLNETLIESNTDYFFMLLAKIASESIINDNYDTKLFLLN